MRKNAAMALPTPSPVLRLCFVCTGNICRSPMAEVILRDLVEQAGMSADIAIDSAGTGEWHVGEMADPRTRASLNRLGYDGGMHRAKQFDPSQFSDYDIIFTFDRSQSRVLNSWAPGEQDRARIEPLRPYDPVADAGDEVPDPYYGDDELFDDVRDMILRACRHLFQQLAPGVRAARAAEARQR